MRLRDVEFTWGGDLDYQRRFIFEECLNALLRVLPRWCKRLRIGAPAKETGENYAMVTAEPEHGAAVIELHASFLDSDLYFNRGHERIVLHEAGHILVAPLQNFVVKLIEGHFEGAVRDTLLEAARFHYESIAEEFAQIQLRNT
jgi:hypothetical protein